MTIFAIVMKNTMEKTSREKRIEAFKAFRDKAETTFNSFKDESPSFQKFHDTYGLNTCPKGRNGGTNERLCEVFYGQRPYDREPELDSVSNISIKRCEDGAFRATSENAERWIRQGNVFRYLCETGATLAFSLLDDGYVLVTLHLPYTERMQPLVKEVVIDFHLDPIKLIPRRLKAYWNKFNLAMVVYSLVGEPKWYHRAYWTCWLFFQQTIKDNYLQERGCYKLAKTLANYVLSVGLSGFLIYLFTIAPQNKDQSRVELLLERLIEQAEDRNQKLDAILSREGSKATTRDSVLRDSIRRRTP